MDRGAWWVTLHGVAKSQTWLSDFTFTFYKSLTVNCLVLSDSAAPWTVDHQAPPSMEFSRQEYWSEVPFLSPGDLPDPEIEPGSPALQADSLPSWATKDSSFWRPGGNSSIIWSNSLIYTWKKWLPGKLNGNPNDNQLMSVRTCL